MEELYSSKWVKRNGSIASKLWIEAINTLTDEQIKLGLMRCKERIFSGNAWAPDLSEFLAMIYGHSDVDFHSAFMRCLSRKPEGRIERWVYENAGYNIRTSPHDAAERMHKKFMNEAIIKDRNGELILNDERLKALPPNSVKNVNDLEREKYNQKNGSKLHPRIMKILGK